MESIVKKLNLSEDVFRNKLIILYRDGKSQWEIANIFGCHLATIEFYFKKFEILCRSRSESARIVKGRNINLSTTENEILNGLMLSDMHIDKGTFQARLTFGVLHKEFATAIIKSLESVMWGYLYPYKPKNSPNLNYFCKSAFSIQLFQLHEKWYKKNIKTIPSELEVISPLTLYWWYLGDGYICKSRNQLALCTDAFSSKENLNLCENINATYNFNMKVDSRNRISMYGSDNIKKFLHTIGTPHIECYEYKWRM